MTKYWLKWAIISFAISISGSLIFSRAQLTAHELLLDYTWWNLTWVSLAVMLGVLLALGELIVFPVSFSQSIWWIAASVVGSLFGLITASYFQAFSFLFMFIFTIVGLAGDANLLPLSHPLLRFVFPVMDRMIIGSIYGSFIASLQCLVLITLKRIPPVRWWIIVNMISFAAMGALSGFFLGLTGNNHQTLATIAGGLTGLLLLGYLLWLFLHQNINRLKTLSGLGHRIGLIAITIGTSYAILSLTAHPNVDLILKQSHLQGQWLVSPNGDSVVYQGNGLHTFVQIIPANQRYTIDGAKKTCSFFEWLDNVTLYCANGHQAPYIFETDDAISLPLEKTTFKEIGLASLVQTADKIYRLADVPSSETLVLVSPTQNKDYVIKGYVIEGVKNADSLLRGRDSVSVTRQSVVDLWWDEQIYSPNHLYYVRLIQPDTKDRTAVSLAIFDATSGRKLSEYITYAISFRVQWASDSSGVFFEPTTGLYGPERKLRKLNVQSS